MHPDVTPSDPAARVQWIQAPISAPGSCALCGVSQHELGFAAPYNMNFEFFGAWIICGTCVGDFARIFNYFSPHQKNIYEEHIVALETRVELAELEVEALGAFRDAVNKLRLDLSLIDSSAGPDDVIQLPTNSDVKPELNETITDDEVTGESEPDASGELASVISDPGPDGLSSDTSGYADNVLRSLGL